VADVVTSRFAWKTGTSSAYRDAWTVAWNPEYAIGVWCGHKRGGFGDKSLVGAKAAAPVGWKIARLLHPQNDGAWFVEPGEIRTVDVCTLTGAVASEDCPVRVKGRLIAGRSSLRPCTAHRKDTRGNVITLLPENEKGGFKIVSPENGAEFQLVSAGLSERIVFRVSGNVDNRRLWWFIDGKKAGETKGNEAFVAQMEDGEHTVAAVDATGESYLIYFKVKDKQGK